MVPVEPGGGVVAALVFDLALLGALAPAAVELLVETEALATVVRHLLTLVNQHMDLLRVVQRLGTVPYHGESRRNIGLSPAKTMKWHRNESACLKKLSCEIHPILPRAKNSIWLWQILSVRKARPFKNIQGILSRATNALTLAIEEAESKLSNLCPT